MAAWRWSWSSVLEAPLCQPLVSAFLAEVACQGGRLCFAVHLATADRSSHRVCAFLCDVCECRQEVDRLNEYIQGTF